MIFKHWFPKSNTPAPVKSIDNLWDEKWLPEDLAEGQLLVDVFQTDNRVIIKAAMAGVKPQDLEITLDHDLLTVRGKREMEKITDSGKYLTKECYWGSFSRSLVLPVEVEEKKIDAVLENGVLTIVLHKLGAENNITVRVK
ncbi:MAG TPA: Hsp20/alpha crystallin family protein [bacterium]|nr:Hsp20/alpha crystallin family protein [bacterium]HPT29399.1 Hsp20/alpha crystallin family protein [bacterium]